MGENQGDKCATGFCIMVYWFVFRNFMWFGCVTSCHQALHPQFTDKPFFFLLPHHTFKSQTCASVGHCNHKLFAISAVKLLWLVLSPGGLSRNCIALNFDLFNHFDFPVITHDPYKHFLGDLWGSQVYFWVLKPSGTGFYAVWASGVSHVPLHLIFFYSNYAHKVIQAQYSCPGKVWYNELAPSSQVLRPPFKYSNGRHNLYKLWPWTDLDGLLPPPPPQIFRFYYVLTESTHMTHSRYSWRQDVNP